MYASSVQPQPVHVLGGQHNTIVVSGVSVFPSNACVVGQLLVREVVLPVLRVCV